MRHAGWFSSGLQGRFDEEAVEVVLSYNLWRGGSDSARKREYYNLYNAAIEERKQACLNVRQEVTIAFNDVEALERQVDVLQGQGMPIADAVRQIGVTQQTYYRWRKLYGGMGRAQLKRLKELEKENQRLVGWHIAVAKTCYHQL